MAEFTRAALEAANAGRRIALVLSGGNVDRAAFASILAEDT